MKPPTPLITALALAGLTTLGAAAVDAQSTFGVSWGFAQSLSETKDFADDFSQLNAEVEVRRSVGSHTSVGVSIGWHVFQVEDPRRTQLLQVPIAISGMQFRTINAFPIVATVHRYFGNDLEPRAYVGAGLGVSHQQLRLDIGILALDEDSWELTAVPEVGFIAPLGGLTELMVNGKYQWSTGDLGTSAIYLNVGILTRPFTF